MSVFDFMSRMKNLALELINVNKIYSNGLHAVKNVSFQVYYSDFIALLGPNGSGKSSILGMISSLINLTNGFIKICDFDIKQHSSLAKNNIGVVHREFNLNIFETPLQVLVSQAGFYGISKVFSLPNANKLLKELRLIDKKHTQVRFLSGGMKRRLMIARALIHKPKVIILDEPTAGVDVESRSSLWEYILFLRQKGLTIILTTHYLEEAEKMCNRMIFLSCGKIQKDIMMNDFFRTIKNERYIFYLKEEIKQLDSLQKKLTGSQIKLINELTIEINITSTFGISQALKLVESYGMQVIDIKSKNNKLENLFIDNVNNEFDNKS